MFLTVFSALSTYSRKGRCRVCCRLDFYFSISLSGLFWGHFRLWCYSWVDNVNNTILSALCSGPLLSYLLKCFESSTFWLHRNFLIVNTEISFLSGTNITFPVSCSITQVLTLYIILWICYASFLSVISINNFWNTARNG